MTTQTVTAASATAPVAPPPLTITPAQGTRLQSTISKGSVWRDGSSYITITNIEGDLVEYGYPHKRDVFYLTKSNFSRNFSVIPAGFVFLKKDKDMMMAELRKCLQEIKEKNLGDHVYAMMDELGL